MGSDLGPEEIIIGIKKALSEDKSDFGIIVVGREETITPMLLRHNLIREQRVRVYNASEVIGMDEKPIQAIKTKKDSSMMRAIEIVKLGTADAVLSCGNTGALMAGGTIKLRTMRGIERPALGTVIPGISTSFLMIYLGIYEPFLAAFNSFNIPMLLCAGLGALAEVADDQQLPFAADEGNGGGHRTGGHLFLGHPGRLTAFCRVGCHGGCAILLSLYKFPFFRQEGTKR